jgi:PAT family beta-lactamase induction signal transducer AmpG
MSLPRKWPTPWVFCLLILPLGMVIGFNFTALPFLLTQAGVPVHQIASINSVSNLPGVLGIVLSPIVDIKLRRRAWLAIGAFGTAAGACLYFPLIGASHLALLTIAIFVSGMVTFFVVAASGGMMVRLLNETDQSRAAAWTQVGVLAGGAISGSVLIWLAERTTLITVGLCFAGVAALLGLIPLTISEPAPAPSAWFSGRFSTIGREILSLARSGRRGWGTLLLLSPCSTGAAQSLLPAIASQYGVGASGVEWINGLGGGVALAAGALLATLVPGKWDRRLSYAAAGVLNALAAVLLMAANRHAVYLIGTALYLVTQGLCWARSVALMVEIVGAESRDASTLYSILNGAVTIPLLYMIWLDGVGFRALGSRGLLGVDAGANIIVFCVVLAALAFRRRSRQATGVASPH